MAHFLFAEWDGGGALPPELAVVRQLIAAGHTVTVLGDPVMEGEVRSVGVQDFRPWVKAPHHVTRLAEDDYIRDWTFTSPIAELDNLFDKLMIGPATLFATETLDAIDDVHPDAMASSFPLFGAQLAAEARKVPQAVLVPNTLGIIAADMPPPGMLPARGPLGRLRDRVSNAVLERILNRGVPRLNEARTALGLAPVSHLRRQYDRADRVLALTSSAFDFPAALPENVRYVGPQLDDPTWARPWTPPADDSRPLVLVAMSTTFMNHLDDLQRVVTALGSLPVRGLVTTGPAVDPNWVQAPDNVDVVSSAPHNQVLAHAAAMLTHGGHGSVMKGLVAGVPMVCLPMGRDQPDNAARLRYHGAGLQVSRKAPSSTIATALRRVLADPSYRNAATRLGKTLRTESDSGTAVIELETLARVAK